MCLPETLKSLAANLVRTDKVKFAAGAATGATEERAFAPWKRYPRISRIIDLTHVMSPHTPVFPGFPPMQIDAAMTHDRDGLYSNELRFSEHTGTHMDAPIHFDKYGAPVHEIPADRLLGPLAVVDISDRAYHDPDTVVLPEDVLTWERRHGRIPNGAIVVMHSGWAERIKDSEAFLNADAGGTPHFPGWSRAATDLLMTERDVVGIGVDTLGLDHGASKEFPVHHSWLPSGRWGLENVANLSRTPPAGATLFVGAPKVYGGSGGPTRLIAVT